MEVDALEGSRNQEGAILAGAALGKSGVAEAQENPETWLRTSLSDTASEARRLLGLKHPTNLDQEKRDDTAAAKSRQATMDKAVETERLRQEQIEADLMKMSKIQELLAQQLRAAGMDNELQDLKTKALAQVAAAEVDEWQVAPRRSVYIPYCDTDPLWDVQRDWPGVDPMWHQNDMIKLTEADLPQWVQQFAIEVIHGASLAVRKLARWWKIHASAAQTGQRIFHTFNIVWKGAKDHTMMGHVLAVLIENRRRNVELGAALEEAGIHSADQLAPEDTFALKFASGVPSLPTMDEKAKRTSPGAKAKAKGKAVGDGKKGSENGNGKGIGIGNGIGLGSRSAASAKENVDPGQQGRKFANLFGVEAPRQTPENPVDQDQGFWDREDAAEEETAPGAATLTAGLSALGIELANAD
jgi:hypothetical protein